MKATAEHAQALARTMRPEERAELAAVEQEPLGALLGAMRKSDGAWTALVDGEVGAMFGVGQLEGVSAPVGHVWFLTGTAFLKHPKAYVKVARSAIATMLEFYPVLANIIDARYLAAVRWAEWLGFSVGAPVPFGPAAMPFRPATLRRETWAR